MGHALKKIDQLETIFTAISSKKTPVLSNPLRFSTNSKKDCSRILLLYLLRGIGKTKMGMGQKSWISLVVWNSWMFIRLWWTGFDLFTNIGQNHQFCDDQLDYLHRTDQQKWLVWKIGYTPPCFGMFGKWCARSSNIGWMGYGSLFFSPQNWWFSAFQVSLLKKNNGES